MRIVVLFAILIFGLYFAFQSSEHNPLSNSHMKEITNLQRMRIEQIPGQYDDQRINDVYIISSLLEEYKKKVGNLPSNGASTIVALAAPEVEQQLARTPNPFGISGGKAFSPYLKNKLEQGLGRKVEIPTDPKTQTNYAPNAYYVYLSGNDYLVIAFLYKPKRQTTKIFNGQANAYAISSSHRMGQTPFWSSAGIKPLIFSEM